MSKKKISCCVDRSETLIDASVKSELTIIADDLELSSEEYEKEIEKLRKSLEQIRRSQFAFNAAIERVQSRSLRDIFLARLNQISKHQVIADSGKKD